MGIYGLTYSLYHPEGPWVRVSLALATWKIQLAQVAIIELLERKRKKKNTTFSCLALYAVCSNIINRQSTGMEPRGLKVVCTSLLWKWLQSYWDLSWDFSGSNVNSKLLPTGMLNDCKLIDVQYDVLVEVKHSCLHMI